MVATSQISQTTLRSVLGQHMLDELLSERDKINAILQNIIDEATSPWGDQGLDRRGQGRRDPGRHAARDGAPGGGRARAAREDHRRRGRVPGLASSSQDAADVIGRIADRAAAALPADAARDRRVECRRRSSSRHRSTCSPAFMEKGRPERRDRANQPAGVERALGGRAALGSRKRRAASIAAPRFRPLSFPCLISITVSTASDVVDPLLLALGRDLRLVRPVVELHLRDAGDPADLAEVELDLVEMLGEVDRLEDVDLLVVSHTDPFSTMRSRPPETIYTLFPRLGKGNRQYPSRFPVAEGRRSNRARPRRPATPSSSKSGSASGSMPASTAASAEASIVASASSLSTTGASVETSSPVAPQAHHDHALRRAPEPLDVLDRHLDHGAAGRDQHHLVAVADDPRAGELALAPRSAGPSSRRSRRGPSRDTRRRACACRSRSRSRRAGRRRPRRSSTAITSSSARSLMPLHARGVAAHRAHVAARRSGSPGPRARPSGCRRRPRSGARRRARRPRAS